MKHCALLVVVGVLVAACGGTPTVAPSVEMPTAASAVETPTGEASQVVIDVPKIIGASVADVEVVTGASTANLPITPGQNDYVETGESRTYKVGDYTFYVDYDESGIARGFVLASGLEGTDYKLSDATKVLALFGLAVSGPPSKTAPAANYWYNQGNLAEVRVTTDTPGGAIWQVAAWSKP
jgi:hypothetical protein